MAVTFSKLKVIVRPLTELILRTPFIRGCDLYSLEPGALKEALRQVFHNLSIVQHEFAEATGQYATPSRLPARLALLAAFLPVAIWNRIIHNQDLAEAALAALAENLPAMGFRMPMDQRQLECLTLSTFQQGSVLAPIAVEAARLAGLRGELNLCMRLAQLIMETCNVTLAGETVLNEELSRTRQEVRETGEMAAAAYGQVLELSAACQQGQEFNRAEAGDMKRRMASLESELKRQRLDSMSSTWASTSSTWASPSPRSSLSNL